MAAMKPRTGDGPLEVTKEGRGIVMRVPLEGGGRLVVELNADEAGRSREPSRTSSADAVRDHPHPTLPAQVSPPEFALSTLRPHAVARRRGRRAAGAPGDRTTALAAARPGCRRARRRARHRPARACSSPTRPPARPARSRRCPVPLGGADNAALRLVLLVGVGEQRARRPPPRRRRAGPGRPRPRRRWPPRSRPSPTRRRPEAFVVGADARVVRVPLALRRRRSTGRSAGSCSPGCPTTPTWPTALARAVAVGGAGWRARMLATVPSNLKNPPGSPSRPRSSPTRPASTSRSGTRSSSRPRASAASSASARPRRPRRG